MDTSKEYILMCEKADEIQKNNDGVSGYWNKDNIICTSNGEFYYQIDTYAERENGEQYIESSKSTWLPRQDQLQEMLSYSDMGSLVFNFDMWVRRNQIYGDSTKYEEFNSMEQLWLAFVMWQKYKKKWNGSEWVKE